MKIRFLLVLFSFLFLYGSCSKEKNENNPQKATEYKLSEYSLSESNTWKENIPTEELIVINSQEELQQYVNGNINSNIDFSTQSLVFLRLQETYQVDSVKSDIEKAETENYVISATVFVNPWAETSSKTDICWQVNKLATTAKTDIELKRFSSNVKNETCSCGSKSLIDYSLYGKPIEVILFKDSIPNHGIYEENIYGGIEYNSETNKAILKIGGDAMTIEICNFPQIAKQWNIPEEGISILLDGEQHESTIARSPYSTNKSFYDLILTFFKKK